ncbi:hypothetical protein BDW62DRAFT_201575 [Aspergillus aurantiobrunneus]
MPIKVYPLTKPAIPGAIDVIQQSFAEDPYFRWVFDRRDFNKARNYGSLEARCLGVLGMLFSMLLWRKMEMHIQVQPELWYSWAQSWLLWFRQGLNNLQHGGRGGLNVRRYYIWKDRQAEAQKSIWDDERGYYFCNIVAVRPDAQGRGVGKMLFEEVMRVADQEGMRCYLESSRNEPNVGIYERLGF